MSDDPRFGLSRRVTLPGPLRLDGGALLSPVDIAYETYGDPAKRKELLERWDREIGAVAN